MDRARQGFSAFVIALFVVMLVVPTNGPPTALAAAVAWPPATLVISEIQTGGSSASDEFVELANQGATTVDLSGLEVVYATASGSTVTRKASWTDPDPARSGAADAPVQRRGRPRSDRRRDVQRWLCGDRWGHRAALRRGFGGRRGRLGRCVERIRRGDAGRSATQWLEPRAPSGRLRRQRDRHQ